MPKTGNLTRCGKTGVRAWHAASNRDYWVCTPASYQPGTAAVPLVMVLHGCGQPYWSHPGPIAYDTHMNHLAEQHQFLVVYPHAGAGIRAMTDTGHQRETL